jgi:holo-[acyl-carrier protein] synthase
VRVGAQAVGIMRPVDPPLIGIDLVETERLADGLARTPQLVDDLFLKQEQAYAAAQPRPIEHLAARFAAKEAVVKALGMKSFEPLDVEVTDGGERCGLRLHGDAADRAAELDVIVSISLTHIGSLGGAIALARPRE